MKRSLGWAVMPALPRPASAAMPFLMAAQAMFAQMNMGRFRVSFRAVFFRVFRLSQFLPDWA